MVHIVEQLCIKSYEAHAKDGGYFKIQQGRFYTTQVPMKSKKTVLVFSEYWLRVPKSHFVLAED